MGNLHHVIKLFLTLTLIFSASFASYGMAQATGGQMIEICSGAGARHAMIGADGSEIPVPHECGECCLSVGLALSDGVETTGQLTASTPAFFLSRSILAEQSQDLFPLARGPPKVS